MPRFVRNRGKRKDGSTKWQARWRDPRNPAVRKEKQFRDKDVARRWLRRMDAEAEGARFTQPTNAERVRLFKEVVSRSLPLRVGGRQACRGCTAG